MLRFLRRFWLIGLLAAAALSSFAGPLRSGPAGDDAADGEPAPAAGTQSPAEQHEAAVRWFRDAKLGLFVHWGVYALAGKGEWVMNKDKIPIAEYEKLPPQFDPVKFDAAAWAKLAKAAGARYLTVTAKHHDGFCMFDSKLTGYDVVDAAPYRKDPMKALAEACREQGIRLFFYYSLLDWHHPDYFPLGRTGQTAGRAPGGDWSKYVAYYQGQVRELCTNYGAIGGIWLDGWWDRPEAEWDLAGTYAMIHQLQPGALVGNNHHVKPFPGEDFQMFEQDLPGQNEAGFNKVVAAQGMPLETCLTVNRSWGYNSSDKKYKSAEELIHYLLGAAGRGANLLINVGPRADGTIGPEFAGRLGEVGAWLARNGPTVYGTAAGPTGPQHWGISTRKGDAIFLHVFTPAGPVELPRMLQAYDAHLLGSAKALHWRAEGAALFLELSDEDRTPVDTIVVLRPIIDIRREPRR